MRGGRGENQPSQTSHAIPITMTMEKPLINAFILNCGLSDGYPVYDKLTAFNGMGAA
jgi:hypothetical protein